MSEYAQTKSSDVPRVPWWLVLIEGIAAILLGLLLFSSPLATTAFLVQFLGIYWFALGLFNIISIFIDRSMWGWKLLSGIVAIIAGVVIFQHPLWSTLIVPTVLVFIVAFSGLFLGLVGLIQAFRGRLGRWHPGRFEHPIWLDLALQPPPGCPVRALGAGHFGDCGRHPGNIRGFRTAPNAKGNC